MADSELFGKKVAKKIYSENNTSTLFVGNLSQTIGQHKLEKLFSDFGPIRRSFVVRNKGVGYVTFALREDAERAIKNGIDHEGKRLNLKFAKRRSEIGQRNASNNADNEAAIRRNNDKEKNKSKPKEKHVNPKKGKLIIRNISFKTDEVALKNEFSRYGNITEVIIPKKPDGKMRGFCFVQFKNTVSAHNAVKGMNGKEFMGRPIAVDFSLPKLKYLDLKQDEENDSDGECGLNPVNDSTDVLDETSKSDCETDVYEDSPCENPEKGFENCTSKSKKNISIIKDEDVHDFNDSDEDDSDDNSDNGDDDDGDGDDNNDDEDDDNDDDDEQDRSETSESDAEDALDDGSGIDHQKSNDKITKKLIKKQPDRPSDVEEGKTLFIRNLSFNTNNAQLNEAFSLFGEVYYALVCIDPNTEYSKGTGFVKFHNTEDAEACVTKSKETDGIVLDGQKLTVSAALSKEELKKRAEEKIKKPKDNRNLYLAREGLIRPGTEAAKDVSKQDLEKRIKLEVWKHTVLRNLNVFVSKYRLCVRNIPLTVDDKKLRNIFMNAAGEGAEVIEARIMRDIRKLSPNGEAVSRGYAFVRYTTHEHALGALRYTNNNPDIFTKNARPIVEFSLENREALNAKQKRLEKSVQNNKNEPKKKSKSGKKMNSQTVGSGTTDVGVSPFSGTKTDPNEKKKGLPSHVGPKVRHKGRKNTSKISKLKLRRDKVKMMQNKRKQKWEKQSITTVKPPKKKRPLDHEEIHLQKLVSSHKRKFSSMSEVVTAKRHKWFQ